METGNTPEPLTLITVNAKLTSVGTYSWNALGDALIVEAGVDVKGVPFRGDIAISEEMAIALLSVLIEALHPEKQPFMLRPRPTSGH